VGVVQGETYATQSLPTTAIALGSFNLGTTLQPFPQHIPTISPTHIPHPTSTPTSRRYNLDTSLQHEYGGAAADVSLWHDQASRRG